MLLSDDKIKRLQEISKGRHADKLPQGKFDAYYARKSFLRKKKREDDLKLRRIHKREVDTMAAILMSDFNYARRGRPQGSKSTKVVQMSPQKKQIDWQKIKLAANRI